MVQDLPEQPQPHPELPGNRLIAGIAILVVGHAAPLAIPLVVASTLPNNWKTALSGLMLFGIPEIGTLLAVVVLGKAGFNALKSKVVGWLGRALFPDIVSRFRYFTGLIFFLIPFLVGWISPYLSELLPNLTRHQVVVAVLGDVMLLVGIGLMGGQFWDKLRSIFVYDSPEILTTITD